MYYLGPIDQEAWTNKNGSDYCDLV